jgi:GTP-binding protein Era
VIAISALRGSKISDLKESNHKVPPGGEPFFAEDEMTDLPTRFFVAEMIREKIFNYTRKKFPIIQR